MTSKELKIIKEHWKVTIIVGRRGGKTSRIGAICVIYQAFRDHGLKRGERER